VANAEMRKHEKRDLGKRDEMLHFSRSCCRKLICIPSLHIKSSVYVLSISDRFICVYVYKSNRKAISLEQITRVNFGTMTCGNFAYKSQTHELILAISHSLLGLGRLIDKLQTNCSSFFNLWITKRWRKNKRR